MKSFKIILILAMLITTVLVCILRPQMHKRVIIGDAKLVLSPVENYSQSQIQTIIQSTSPGVQIQQPTSSIARNTAPLRTQNYQTQTPIQSYTTGKLVDQDLFNPQSSRNTPPAQTYPTTPPPHHFNRSRQTMTPEQAEIIAWNKWRSDLQNKVLNDTQISAPIGTIFKFSFTVDREGNISNLKTWSTNPEYTPMAVKSVKPVILSYQGKSILNFPPESKRITTNVDGYFMTWTSTGYSTPSDYSDYERVNK